MSKSDRDFAGCPVYQTCGMYGRYLLPDALWYCEQCGDDLAGPVLRVGSTLVAKRDSGVCRVGERGVCYEVYSIGGRPGWSILFERGGYDGFSPSDVFRFLDITGKICAEVACYEFTNVNRLTRDYSEGRFADAFG